MTNEILDTTINGQTIQVAVQTNLIPEKFSDKPQCIMCEFIMKQLEDELKDKRTEVRIY